MNHLLENKNRFLNATTKTLNRNVAALNSESSNPPASSAVLFLMGEVSNENDGSKKPCLILNKRSRRISQPGDLCFPGGAPTPRIDAILAKLLYLPGFPLGRWLSRTGWNRPDTIQRLAPLLATCLRESFEEMGLLPFVVRFLGPLPPQRLIMFNKTIFPMVGWIRHQTFFRLNGEVEKVIRIPVESLLEPENYAAFEINYPSGLPSGIDQTRRKFPCFVHRQGDTRDILWGATFRIAMTFLAQVFDFTPPEIDNLPEIDNHLSPEYFNKVRKR